MERKKLGENCTLVEKATEKAVAPHSSTLAWKIPWAEEPGGLQSMGSHRVGHNRANEIDGTSCQGMLQNIGDSEQGEREKEVAQK